MKKLILLTLITTFAMSGFINESEFNTKKEAQDNDRLCKVFTTKVEKYKATMREDSLAQATLRSYEKRMHSYCDVSTAKTEIKRTPKVKEVATATSGLKANTRLCNVFTKKVAQYESTMRDDAFAKATLHSYKERKASFCAATGLKS